MLLREGGPFDIGAIVHLGDVNHDGTKPEVEDYRFDLSNARFIENEKADEFWQQLENCSKPSLERIFGPELRFDHEHMTVKLGCGQASLGCLAPVDPPALFYDRNGRVRARLERLWSSPEPVCDRFAPVRGRSDYSKTRHGRARYTRDDQWQQGHPKCRSYPTFPAHRPDRAGTLAAAQQYPSLDPSPVASSPVHRLRSRRTMSGIAPNRQTAGTKP